MDPNLKEVKLNANGNIAPVADNAIAKIMYYLKCVSTVINRGDDTLTEYQNYNELTGEELASVYEVAKIVDPSIFLNAGVFIVNPNLITNTLDNQFFDVAQFGTNASPVVMVGGSVAKVLKIMVCRENWLSTYYYTPMKILNNSIGATNDRSYSHQIIKTQTSFFEERPDIVVGKDEFRDHPIKMTCPKCKVMITSQTETKFNFGALAGYIFLGCIFYCIQIRCKKNICCMDKVHKCPKCGMTLGSYSSC